MTSNSRPSAISGGTPTVFRPGDEVVADIADVAPIAKAKRILAYV